MSTLPSTPLARLTLPAVRASDAPLVEAAHHDEVLRLYDAHGPQLRRYVRSLGLPAEAVEDVLQELFLTLFHHLERGRSRANLRGWLFQVGQRLALKHRARLARRWRREQALDPRVAELVSDPGPDAEQRLLTGARARRLTSVYRALPERDQRCVSLRAEGLRYREIAAVLEVSLGTVAKSIARAVARFVNAEGGADRAR